MDRSALHVDSCARASLGADLLEGIIILGWLCHLESVVLHSFLELLEVHSAQGLKVESTHGERRLTCQQDWVLSRLIPSYTSSP